MEYRKFSTFIEKTQYGYTADETSPETGDAKYLRITDIVPYFVDKDRVPYCIISDEKKAQYLVNENDLLIARTGATTGYNLVVPKGFSNYVFASYLVRYYYRQNELFPQYLKHVLKSQQYYGFVNNYISGSAQPGMNPKAFGRFEVPYVSYEMQKRIAQILSTYDNLIEVNNKRIKVLEQMAENLYKEWFVRFRFPGHETAEFENGIPKGWEYCTVESLSAVLQRGISPDYDDDGELTVISQKCIRQNIMDIREARKQNKEFKTELNIEDGDTVICSTGTGTLGRVGQVYGEYSNTTFDSHVTLIRATETVGKHYLYWTLKEMQSWFMNMGIGSTNQQELYRGTIKNAKALKPNADLMERFDQIIELIHKNIIMLINKQENLTRQRDLLLPRLMSGKLEV
ncbi:MAG: restriction endonuclease subunit S [Clostridia bacterium]|nr:restriction endonuclease subunit S [Clostridia bacterium]